jgi:hypothetical protein
MCAQIRAPAALAPSPAKEPPATNLIGGWAGRRGGLDAVNKRKSLSSAWNQTPIPLPSNTQSVAIPTEQ